MSTAEPRQAYKIAAIQRATELVARSKELVRELRASTRENSTLTPALQKSGA
jgi:hypothetical protein